MLSKKGKLSPEGANPDLNCFGVKSRLSLQEWQEYGWVPNLEGHIAKQYDILSNPKRTLTGLGLGYGIFVIGWVAEFQS